MRLAREARERNDVGALLDVLNGTDLMGRVSAARILGEMGTSQAVEPLIRCLNAHDELLRMATLNALARIGDTSAADAVFEVGLHDENFLVSFGAAEALASLGDRRAVEVFGSLLDEDPRPPRLGRRGNRRYATKQLVALNGNEALPALEAAAARAWPLERWRLRKAIAALKRS